MTVVLFPESSHSAIEERYASWQCELVVRRQVPTATFVRYRPGAPVRDLLAGVAADLVLGVTTPLIIPPNDLVKHLREALAADPAATAALPVLNFTTVVEQHEPPPEIYLTLQQLERTASTYASRPFEIRSLRWTDADPSVFLARADRLRDSSNPVDRALAGNRVAIDRRAYVHRFAAHRAQLRLDLLDRIDRGARVVLEFGCGEGGLGAALKERQACRVVGVELDAEAAAVARTRLDAVHEGDVTEVIEGLEETFDFVVGGDILEHIEDPWTFLQRLRRVMKPGGHLLLSLPNISAWPIVADLLEGRFDYVYMGIVCAGHVRFFTKQTIRDMLSIAGWTEVSLTDQMHVPSPEFDKLIAALAAGGIRHSVEDLNPTGHYVLARTDAV